jgi:hypothetical protein
MSGGIVKFEIMISKCIFEFKIRLFQAISLFFEVDLESEI